MELNIDAVFAEAGSIATGLAQRCLLLAGQVKSLQDQLAAAQKRIAELEKSE